MRGTDPERGSLGESGEPITLDRKLQIFRGLRRWMPPGSSAFPAHEMTVSDRPRDGGRTEFLCHGARSTRQIAPGHSPDDRKNDVDSRQAIVAVRELGGGHHDDGASCPAHGSQPGAQAGRHALEGREDLRVGIAHDSDLDAQKRWAVPTLQWHADLTS